MVPCVGLRPISPSATPELIALKIGAREGIDKGVGAVWGAELRELIVSATWQFNFHTMWSVSVGRPTQDSDIGHKYSDSESLWHAKAISFGFDDHLLTRLCWHHYLVSSYPRPASLGFVK